MELNIIHNFNDFCNSLYQCGFSIGGENDEGVFSLCKYYGQEIEWHTDNIETDPWEWRIRVLNERNDIAYAKLFFNKSGYISKEWYPYFMSARRNGISFNDAYNDGKMSIESKKIYDLIKENNELPLHIIKQLGGFSKETKTKFDRAMVDLQMKMYITMCGSKRKSALNGDEYGWNSTVFCLTDNFFETEVFEKSAKISPEDAQKKIAEQVYKLNPEFNPKKIKKFIFAK